MMLELANELVNGDFYHTGGAIISCRS